MEGKEKEFTFEIVRNIGIINEYSTGWKKELNLVVWNGGSPKYDIRDWDTKHEHMSRGITLHPDEAEKLYRLLEESIDKCTGTDDGK